MNLASARVGRVLVACFCLGLVGLATPSTAYPRPGRTELISRTPQGISGNQLSTNADISREGRFVAFDSDAENLIPHDTNGATDVFVYDRATGRMERVSVTSDGSAASGHSYRPSISADGRFVAFESDAENLVPPTPGDNNRTRDAFIHDRLTGITEIVSIATDGTQADQYSAVAVPSADGRFVAFQSVANNLTPGDTNIFGGWDVFVRDREQGTTERVSVASGGGSLGADETATSPSISGDGRFVSFRSNAASLVPGDTNRIEDIYVRDRVAGTTLRVGVPPGQEPNGLAFGSAISEDGRFVAFGSQASNLVPQDTNGPAQAGGEDVFVWDRLTNVTERVSVNGSGVEGNSDSFAPSISADGRFVAFGSLASNLVPGENDGEPDPITGAVPGDIDLFVHDRATGSTDRVSLTSEGAEPDNQGEFGVISGDGRVVSFVSMATNLAPGDTNETADVFVRDRGPAVGVGGLSAQPGPGGLSVSGWATFSGATLASVTDPAGDGGPGAEQSGTEVLDASLIYRPEPGDLLARIRLAALPSVRPYHPSIGTGQRQYAHLAPSLAGAPAVVYTMEMSRGGTRFEVRVARFDSRGADPSFSLWRCMATCTNVADLEGSYGGIGNRIDVAVPLQVIGATEGDVLSQVTAHAGLGDSDRGVLRNIDDAVLGNALIPVPEVRLGVATPGTPESEVSFDTPATMAAGGFSGFIQVAGTEDVWARACLGETCGATKVER